MSASGPGSVKVEVEVGACKLEHDGASFLDYSYEVRLVCEDMFGQRLVRKSTRSLLDFCELEARLLPLLAAHNLLSPFHSITMGIVKKHSEWRGQRREEGGGGLASRLISLGLGGESSHGQEDSQGQGQGQGQGQLGPAESHFMQNFQYTPIFGGDRDQYLKLKFDESVGKENLLFKSTELGVWMLQVLREPAILESASFAYFFSTAEKCYRRQNLETIGGSGSGSGSESVSEYTFLLPPKHIKTKTVLSKHTEKIEVQRGQIVLWRFTSSKNDMAFSVDLDGRSLLGAKKYPSSGDEIFGSLEMTPSTAGVGNLVGNGLCELKFDNKYAKLMTPTQVRFYCRAVDPVEYVDCKRRASEKIESLRRKEAAFDEVMAIFEPRAALLREEGVDMNSHIRVSSYSTCSPGGIGVGSSPEQLTDSDVMSNEDLIAGKDPETAVSLLLKANAKLREENDALSKKCAQLQSKIDVVLNFANTNNENSSSKKPSSLNVAGQQHQRRQTFAAYGDQPHGEASQQKIMDCNAMASSNSNSNSRKATARNIKVWEKTPHMVALSTSNSSSSSSETNENSSSIVARQNEILSDSTILSDSSVSDVPLTVKVATNVANGISSGICRNVVIDIDQEMSEHHEEVAVFQKVERDSDDEDSD